MKKKLHPVLSSIIDYRLGCKGLRVTSTSHHMSITEFKAIQDELIRKFDNFNASFEKGFVIVTIPISKEPQRNSLNV